MKALAAAGLVLALAACASTSPDDPFPAPAPAPDPRVAELQTGMTEMLERMDVLNDRIARLEEDRAAMTAIPPSAPSTTPRSTAMPSAATPAAPQQRALIGAKLADDYRRAIMLFGQGKHADARRAFQEVFDADSAGNLADNALFWIGETYLAAGDVSNALRYYARVVNEYPEENKAPDALYKSALAHVRTGDLALARKTLGEVIERYPFSSSASAAKAELQRIRF